MGWSAAVTARPTDDAIRELGSQIAAVNNSLGDQERTGNVAAGIERRLMHQAFDLVKEELTAKGFKHCTVSMHGHIVYTVVPAGPGPENLPGEYEIDGGELYISINKYVPLRE